MSDREFTKFKRCPYCGERVASRGLFLHVLNSDDDEHRAKGEVPEGFDASGTPVSGEALFDEPTNGDGLHVMCKFCGETFETEEALGQHLATRKEADSEIHPPEATTSTAALYVPSDHKPTPIPESNVGQYSKSQDTPMARFRRRYQSDRDDESLKFVPISELKELREWAREREGESGAYVQVSKKLDELVEKYG